MQDDELARRLGPAAFRVLSQWSAQRHLHHRFVRAFGNGATDAKVMVVDRHDQLNNTAVRLVLKLDRFTGTDFGTTEYARHGQAIHDSGSWAKQHLAHLVDSPIPVDDGWWLVFQSVAGNLDQFTLLGDLVRELSDENAEPSCTSAELVEFFVAIVTGVLADWAGPPNVTYLSVPKFLEAHLGYRLAEGKPLRRMPGSSSEPTLALLRDHSLTDGVELTVPVGIGHGDLHVDNAMVRIRPSAVPGDFRLIDLAKRETAGPLGRDPAHLLVHMINGVLQHLAPSALGPLRRVLLDPEHVHRDRLPVWLRDIITRTYEAAEQWIEPSGYGPDWRLQRPLSLYAATLMVYVRDATRPEDKPWLKALADEAAETFLATTGGSLSSFATGTVSAPVPRMDAVAIRPRVLAEDRASLEATSMPPVSREDLLRSAASLRDTHARTAGRRQILALTGEGGIGKSVLLGQHLDRLDADADRAVVLVVCGNVPPGAELGDLDSVDKALGVAANPKHGRDGLRHLLVEQREAHGAVTVLIDTLDLVLRPDTAVSVAVLLVEALDIGDVVMTCRTYEFTNYLRSIPRLTGRVTAFPLPSLDELEIVAWAKQYLQQREQTTDHSNFIESLSGLISASKSLQNVCSLPVRLALACATFADRGHLPENLTVTGLYEAYWDMRVDVHGTTKERAALQVARHVVTQSGQIALRIPKANVDDELRDGVESLISEGVLREYGTEWEFFHQTFAEFAHARWALIHGIESTAVSGLINHALSGPANLWPVLTSLLLQIRAFEDYQALARKVPMINADAAQTQTLGALQRGEPEALETLLAALSGQRELLLMTLTALGDAPAQHIPIAVAGALDALRADPEQPSRAVTQQVSRAVDALSRLVPREATNADLLHDALLAVSALTGLADGQRHGYLERLVKPFTTIRATAEKLAVLRTTYPKLGPMGRRDAIRAHRLDGVPKKDFVAIARIAMDYACPPLNDSEQVDLMATLWHDPTERADLGWSSWRDVLASPMKKDWDNAHVKFVVHLANLDGTLAEELFDELMHGESTSPEPHVNAVGQVVTERTGWAAERLLSGKPPQTDLSLNAVAKIGPDFAASLDHDTRLRMIDWLRPARQYNPRAVWPTQFILAADDLDTHRLLLEQLRATAPEAFVLIGVIQSISYLTPLHALALLAPDIRDLTNRIQPRANSPATEKLRIRARLEGRLAESDADARLWIQQQVVAGTSPSVAGTVVKTLADTYPAGPPKPVAAWMGTLLRTPHTDAAERLTQLLLAAPSLDTDSFNALTHTAIDRMRAAADNREDSRLHRSLLNLVIKLDKAQPIDEPKVQAIYEIVRSRLSGSEAFPGDQSAALRDLSTLSGTLMARHMDSGTVRDLIGEALTGPRAARVGEKLIDSVASLLFSILGRDPDAPMWLTSIFGASRTHIEIKLAIAKALLQYEGNKPGGYASALKDRPDCPAEVATLIVPRLQT